MRQLLILTLTLVLALSLAACGAVANNDNGDENSSTNPPASQDGAPASQDGAPASQDGGDTASSGDANNADAPAAGDPQGSENLIPIGATATSTFANRYGVTHSVSMCVEETIRGEAALSFINDHMMAEKKAWAAVAPDEEDQEYIVAKITYTLLAYDDGDLREPSFCYAYSGTFEAYPNLLAAMFYDADNNYPELSSLEVNVGETVTAYEIFQISKADPSPVMAYASHLADLSDGLWFQLY